MSLLEARTLVKEYGDRRVVMGISIEVAAGEVVGLLGPNGAGKTTTFSMIAGRISPTEGQVIFAGRDVTKLPMYQRARAGMSYLAQEPSIFDGLTVAENLLAVLEFHERDRVKRRARLSELLAKLGLEPHADKQASRLSGGYRRRLEITRALITRPKLLMLDEPFAGVDPLVVEDLQRIIGDLKREGLGLLITDHNVHATLRITDRAYIVHAGEVLASGTASELANNEVARSKYLGSSMPIHG